VKEKVFACAQRFIDGKMKETQEAKKKTSELRQKVLARESRSIAAAVKVAKEEVTREIEIMKETFREIF